MLLIPIRGPELWDDPEGMMQAVDDDRFYEPLPGGRKPPPEEQTGRYPIDMWESDDAIRVEAELPGFARDEIEVSLDEGALTILAEREPGEIRGNPRLSERRFTRVERTLALPADVDESKAEAQLREGVLYLVLPKRGGARARRIEVR
jgi:HSP20 family protein